ncbi:MAG: CotH kinase family protein [Singulisphaera sp.]
MGPLRQRQQFDKKFLSENYPSAKGTRWKVKGNPGGGGGLDYVGDKIEDSASVVMIKTDDDEKAWKALVTLCKTLNETSPERLEEPWKPILDVEGVLRFLALDNALINNDGYWVRASDYNLFRDQKGVFHVIPHDANNPRAGDGIRHGSRAGAPGEGPGDGPAGRREPRADRGGARPVRGPCGSTSTRWSAWTTNASRCGAACCRARPEGAVPGTCAIAEDWLDWESSGRSWSVTGALIEEEVEADTPASCPRSPRSRSPWLTPRPKTRGPLAVARVSASEPSPMRRKYLLSIRVKGGDA